VILVVSHAADDHTERVLAGLDRIGHPASVVDTAQFPSKASLTLAYDRGGARFVIGADGQDIDLGSCRTGWWRRPQPFTLDPEIAPDVASFAYSECHEAVAGLWAALGLDWVNPPALDEAAHHKPYQLAVAGALGLAVPRTLITNDPDAARRFIDEIGVERTIYKTFLATEAHWRETRVVRPAELAMLESVRLAPVIFQEYVAAVADLRVTVVGDRMFAAAIAAPSGGYDIDYRMDLDGSRFEPAELPRQTEEGIRALMSKLGLVYGAIDLRRTADGGDVFLEVNPAGEWLFVEERTGQPITEAMVSLLTGRDRRAAKA
jgi:glutathione synthase/RimK-type ligase-like ATP-grasp enzyme